MGSNLNAPSSASAVPTLQNKCSVSSIDDDNDNDNNDAAIAAAATMLQAKRKCVISIMVDNDTTDAKVKIHDKGMVSLNHYV